MYNFIIFSVSYHNMVIEGISKYIFNTYCLIIIEEVYMYMYIMMHTNDFNQRLLCLLLRNIPCQGVNDKSYQRLNMK